MVRLNESLKLSAKSKNRQKDDSLKGLSQHYKELQKFINAMILGGGEMSEGRRKSSYCSCQ